MNTTSYTERLNSLNLSNTFNNFPKFLRENFSIFFVLSVGFIGWFFNIYDYTFIFLGFYFCLILLFNCNVKNVFPAFFMISSCIISPYHYFPYVVGLGLTFLGFAFYIIRNCLINHKKVSKGKLFWGFVFLTIAFVFGGLIGHFRIIYNLLVLGLCLGGYLVYFLAINFCTNFKVFFRNTIIGIGILLIIQFFVCHIQNGGNLIYSITNKSIIEVGAQNINNVAIYFSLTMVCFFQIAYKNKRDYLYCLIAIFWGVMTFLTYCRFGTLVAGIIGLTCLIIVYIKSQNKKIFNVAFVVMAVAIIAILLLAFVFKKIDIFNWYLKFNFFGANGREVMYPWAFEQFKQNPIFGIGFYIPEGLPIAEYIKKVTVDNTVLQYLLSTGAWGLIFASVFYFFKYKILFKNFNEFKLFNFLSVLTIALNGITSQAPTTDVFFVVLSILFVASAEIDTFEKEKEEELNNNLFTKNVFNKTNKENKKNKKTTNTAENIKNKKSGNLEKEIKNKKAKSSAGNIQLKESSYI